MFLADLHPLPVIAKLVEGRHVELTITASAVLLVTLVVLAWKWYDDGIPGKLGLPLINDDLFYILKPGIRALAILNTERRKKYGDVYKHRLLGEVVLSIGGIDNVKKLLANEHILVESCFPSSVQQLLGAWSLSCVHGKTHTALRKPLTHLFSAGAIRGYLPGIQRIMESRLRLWESEGRVSAFDEVKEITIQVLMQLVLGCSPAEAFEGMDVGNGTALWDDFTKGLFSLPINLPGTTFYKALKARKVLDQAANKIIQTQLQQLSSAAEEQAGSGSKSRSIVQLMLDVRDEEGNAMTPEQMLDMTITMMWAGHDTTASTMLILLRELPGVPEVMEKLREEQRQVVAEHGEVITEAALKAMPYAEVTVREALRHTPIVGAIPREVLQDFEMGGYRIRKGQKVWLNLRSILDSPEWLEPEAGPLAYTTFNPDRWMDDSNANARVGWMGFGQGVRMCLGYPLAVAELKVLLALLARSYSWQLQAPEETWSYFPLPVPSKGMPITVQRV